MVSLNTYSDDIINAAMQRSDRFLLLLTILSFQLVHMTMTYFLQVRLSLLPVISFSLFNLEKICYCFGISQYQFYITMLFHIAWTLRCPGEHFAADY